jgi:hypothetical protein
MKAILGSTAILTVAVAAFAAKGEAQQQAPPRNESPPTISGTAQEGQTLTADPGRWSGDAPIVFTYRWQRCNTVGANCVDIPGGAANDRTYVVRNADVGDRLRVRVTARNADGERSAVSAPTAVVTARPTEPPPGSVIPVTAVTPPNRLVVSAVSFNPAPITSRSAPINVRVEVRDTRGFRVNGALVFLRSTPVVTTTPPEAATGSEGTVSFVITPEADFRIVFRPGYAVQFFIRARKPGDNVLAGVSSRRLVQVRVRPS